MRKYGFGGEKPRPCSERADRIAKAVVTLLQAEIELGEARTNIPDYTGQWSDEDYLAEAQEDWNRAADDLEAALTP